MFPGMFPLRHSSCLISKSMLSLWHAVKMPFWRALVSLLDDTAISLSKRINKYFKIFFKTVINSHTLALFLFSVNFFRILITFRWHFAALSALLASFKTIKSYWNLFDGSFLCSTFSTLTDLCERPTWDQSESWFLLSTYRRPEW